jgi:hypothetical protein
MSTSRHYDTVAFDVRDNATMLFFARTADSGDIEDYLLVMRAVGEDFEELRFLEINEKRIAGNDPIREAEMGQGMLTLYFSGPVPELGGESELLLTFDNTDENRAAIETGTFRVLGDKLTGGHA